MAASTSSAIDVAHPMSVVAGTRMTSSTAPVAASASMRSLSTLSSCNCVASAVAEEKRRPNTARYAAVNEASVAAASWPSDAKHATLNFGRTTVPAVVQASTVRLAPSSTASTLVASVLVRTSFTSR